MPIAADTSNSWLIKLRCRTGKYASMHTLPVFGLESQRGVQKKHTLLWAQDLGLQIYANMCTLFRSLFRLAVYFFRSLKRGSPMRRAWLVVVAALFGTLSPVRV